MQREQLSSIKGEWQKVRRVKDELDASECKILTKKRKVNADASNECARRFGEVVKKRKRTNEGGDREIYRVVGLILCMSGQTQTFRKPPRSDLVALLRWAWCRTSNC